MTIRRNHSVAESCSPAPEPPAHPAPGRSAYGVPSLSTRSLMAATSRGVDRVPRAYVECTGYEDSVMGPFVVRAESEGWLHREVATEHDLHLFDPEGTAEVLDELATVGVPARQG